MVEINNYTNATAVDSTRKSASGFPPANNALSDSSRVNGGKAATVTTVPCPQPRAWIECPLPCDGFSSCSTQSVVFGLQDTSGCGLDTMDLYFSTIVTHPSGDVDTTIMFAPSPNLNYSISSDTIRARVSGSWSDGDHVVINFDSLNCPPVAGEIFCTIIETDLSSVVLPWLENRYLVQTAGGGYILTTATTLFGAGGNDLFLVKFNSSGMVEWARTAGRTSSDYGRDLVQTTDSGYAVSGAAYFGTSYDLFLAKFTSTGILEWARTAGGAGFEIGKSILQTDDEGYAISGHSGFDLFFIKFTHNGISCISKCVTPFVTSPIPIVISPTPTVTNPTLTVTNPPFTVTSPTPTVTNCCP